MDSTIKITDRDQVHRCLQALQPGTQPLFGSFTAQQMVEHLELTVNISNGRVPDKLYVPVEVAEKTKTIMLYTDRRMPKGFASPLVGSAPPALVHPDLTTACAKLEEALAAFFKFFDEQPHASLLNPVMGALQYQEWVVFHNKHFAHHFEQFGLLGKGR